MRHKAVVTEILPLAPAVIQLTVAFEGDFSFQPGQWVSFHLGDGLSRAYTIASAPERPKAVQLCVRLGPGRGGEAIQRIRAGDEVDLDGPFGNFVLPPGDTRGVVLLAGDVGIAPVRSIVLHLLATGDRRPIAVLYEPDQRHILYAADFDPLARGGTIIHVSGAIETLVSRHRTLMSNSILMAAGFDGFLDRARDAVRFAGADPDTMIVESFGPP